MSLHPGLLPSVILCLACLARPADLAAQSTAPSEIADLTLLALDVKEQRAVLKVAPGELLLVAPGDTLLERSVTVRRVLGDRLVLSQRGSGDNHRLVWLYPVDPATGRSAIRYLDRRPDNSPSKLRPASPDQDSGDGR